MDIFDTFLNAEVMRRTFPMLLQGLWITLQLGAASIVAGLVLGLGLAMARLYGPGPVRFVTRLYIDIFRSIPLLVLLIIVYYALPFVGLRLSPFASAMSALTLVSGAYTAEIFRAGIMTVAPGQREAAMALGLSPTATFVHIILPQAMRTIIPPTTSQFISMLKDSSLISVMGVWEVMFLAQSYGRSTYRYIEMLTTAAVIYWLLSIGLELLQHRLERHYGKGFKNQR